MELDVSSYGHRIELAPTFSLTNQYVQITIIYNVTEYVPCMVERLKMNRYFSEGNRTSDGRAKGYYCTIFAVDM